MSASWNGYVEVVKELIEKGADINTKTNDKRIRDKNVQHYI